MTDTQKTEPAKAAEPKQSNADRALAVVNSSLETYKEEFTKLLGGSVDPEVFMSVAYEAARTNPDLLEIALHAPDSLMKALHDAAALKLVPNGVLGSAYIVPRRNKNTQRKEAHFQVGYRGLVELIIRSGHVSHVESRLVYQKDDFELTYGTTPGVIHHPYLEGERGPLKGAYAVAFMRDGSKVAEFMSVAQINAIRERAPSKSGPWTTDYEEMCRKTVVRRLAKSLPMSVEVQKAVELDDRGETEGAIVATVERPTPAKSLAGRIRQTMASAEPAEKPEPKDVTPTNGKTVDMAATVKPAAAAEPTPAQDAADAEPPAKKPTRKGAAKPDEAQEQPDTAPDDSIEPPADDVPDDEPVSDNVVREYVSDQKPPRELIVWAAIAEPQPKGGVKLITEAWKAKLVPPVDDNDQPFDDDRVAQFLQSLDQAYHVTVRGILELVAWEKDGKAMPPYRKITAYMIEGGGPVES